MEKIKAGEGMYLTQKKELVNEGARVFAVSLWLADNDSPENWREATQEEYYEWQRRQEELTEAALNGEPDSDGDSDSGADGSDSGADGSDSGADGSAGDGSAADASAADGKEAGV